MTGRHDFIGHSDPRIIALHYKRLMRRSPVLPGYDPSSEMGPKSHNTITIPTIIILQKLEPVFLSSCFSPVNSRCPPAEKLLKVTAKKASKVTIKEKVPKWMGGVA
ncbi:hypothetical protein AVEN_10968-1 [Araneus ventricosus]|uniref:Uncharacterized protein n=1 Tax=Araneus ventricosus TaxID=182803 RepID=A0A4Y2EQR1_ARAVE|nr:hypothetical protein AVEN_10968-1 [Araneus ventricosus]